LVDQDTTIKTGGFGGSTPVKAGGTLLEGGCFLCGGPHLKKGKYDIFNESIFF
jgi:microfibrillar-associated protein 1